MLGALGALLDLPDGLLLVAQIVFVVLEVFFVIVVVDQVALVEGRNVVGSLLLGELVLLGIVKRKTDLPSTFRYTEALRCPNHSEI